MWYMKDMWWYISNLVKENLLIDLGPLTPDVLSSAIVFIVSNIFQIEDKTQIIHIALLWKTPDVIRIKNISTNYAHGFIYQT